MFDIFNLQAKKKQLDEARAELESVTKQLHEAQIALGEANNIIQAQELGLKYTPAPDGATILEIKLNEAEKDLSKFLATKDAIITTRDYIINNSVRQGRMFQKNYCKNLLTGFNVYFNQKEKTVSSANYQHTVELVTSAFNRMNKQGSIIGVSISREYLNKRLNIMKLRLDLKIRQKQMKEQIKAEKAKLREQELLLAEAEKERKRLEDEKKAMNIAFNRALTDSERQEIKDKLNDIDKRLADVDWRIEHNKAGWVYVISSPSLPGMCKIGVTRRLSGPMERCRELSSSSLPYPFELKAYCFAEDAFDIESKMHKFFDAERVSENREFFYVTIEEAINALKNNFNQTVYYGTYVEKENEDADI